MDEAEIKEGSFADGLRVFNTRGALYVPGVKLTKERGRLILDLIEEHKYRWNTLNPESERDNDFQSAMQIIANIVFKRWSQAELYSDNDARKKKGPGVDTPGPNFP